MKPDSVVEALEVPGAVNAVEIDEREKSSADHLVVVAQQGSAPPGFLDSPVVADLDRLADAGPAQNDRLSKRVEVDVDCGVLAEQPGHAVTLESSPAGGTAIELRLPLVGAEGTAIHAPEATGGHVLVVEDDELVRRLVVQTLEVSSYRVTASDSPADALELVRSGAHFDLLLTDLVMPGLYGDELVAQVRALHPGLPAIVMSGYVSDPDTLPESVGFLAKPFRPAELVAAVARTLESSQPQP